MRRLLYLIAFASLVFSGTAHARYASIVIEAGSGKVLHAINADTRNHPASLTKMMTLYMIFEALDSGRLRLDQPLKVSRVAAGRSPSKLGLRRGRSITVRDIISALITKSANDAATVAAEALGKTERRFGRMMTAKARALGMTRTDFRNASGLPHYRQLSTARDMATLVAALVRDFPHHYHYFSIKQYSFKGRKFRNHNRLLSRYQGMDGVKTGYIRASGYNLASSAARDGIRLIGIIFGGRSVRWRDRHMTWLLNRAYAGLTPAETITAAAAEADREWPPKPGRKPLRIAGRGDWSIQVGTFRRFARAHLALTRAARAEPKLIRSPISILSDEGDEGRVYRARLVGLSEKIARNSCQRLMRRSISCIAVPTEDAIGQGSR